MTELVPFRLKLTGDTSDRHQFQGYDGYMALAGFAWTLALATNYADTGTLRYKGDFPGRNAVRATAIAPGSMIADFTVWLSTSPTQVAGVATAVGAGSLLLYDLVQSVIARNLGDDYQPKTATLTQLLKTRGGDLDTLVAMVEAPIRQTHSVIGNGAKKIEILGGHNIINTYNEQTRDYVKLNVYDDEVREGPFTVAAFNVNSGYGSVFQGELHRTIPISMSKEVRQKVSSVFTWGLDQYANKKLSHIQMKYTRVLAMDNTPKRYIVLDAERISGG